MQSQDSAKSMHCVLLFVYNKLYSTETCVQWKNVQVPMNFFASSFHCSPLPWYWWKLFFWTACNWLLQKHSELLSQYPECAHDPVDRSTVPTKQGGEKLSITLW